MNKRIKLSSEEVKEPNDEVLNIDGLPEEIFEKIFGYLKPKDLCQIGRVCKKWHAITRYPVFWKRVDVNFSGKCGSMSEAAMKFVQMLPSCVTHLRLDFTYSEDWALNLRDLSVILQERCPRLEVLIFHRARFITINISRATLYVCEQLMANIRVLVFHHTALNDVTMLDLSDAVLSKIAVLDISRSAQMLLNDSFVSRVPNLKKMRLAGSGISDYTFETHPSIVSRLEVLDLEGTITGYFAFKSVRNYGFHLVELYMCFTLVQDDDLVFEKPADALPRLKKVCLRASNVTYKGIISLLKSCKSLQHICVGQPVTDPENDYSKCNSEKVEIIDGFLYCDHYAKINYMHV